MYQTTLKCNWHELPPVYRCMVGSGGAESVGASCSYPGNSARIRHSATYHMHKRIHVLQSYLLRRAEGVSGCACGSWAPSTKVHMAGTNLAARREQRHDENATVYYKVTGARQTWQLCLNTIRSVANSMRPKITIKTLVQARSSARADRNKVQRRPALRLCGKLHRWAAGSSGQVAKMQIAQWSPVLQCVEHAAFTNPVRTYAAPVQHSQPNAMKQFLSLHTEVSSRPKNFLVGESSEVPPVDTQQYPQHCFCSCSSCLTM